MKGYLQVYTGDGKGKTTAAIGLAVRAAGAGLNVFIAQFVKGAKYSELSSLKKLKKNIVVRQYGRRCFIHGAPEEADLKAAKIGLKESERAISSGKYDLVVLDEANIAVYFRLFKVEELLSVIKRRPSNVEIVVTGRKADPRLLKAADLVTDMREVKHYYSKGIKARSGIEK